MEGKKADKNVLNIGLSFAMEFGEHWGQPIQSRLAEQFPALSPGELDVYNSICQSVMRASNNLVFSLVEKNPKNVNQQDWETTILNLYPWINEANLSHLFSQGMYYAYK